MQETPESHTHLKPEKHIIFLFADNIATPVQASSVFPAKEVIYEKKSIPCYSDFIHYCFSCFLLDLHVL